MQQQDILIKPTLAIKYYFSLLYPWLIWAVGSAFFFYKYLVQVSPSVMTNELMKEFNVQATGLGNLSSCYFYSYLLMQIPVGILLDKYSPRYLTTFAILLCGCSTILFANADSLFLAALARALIGLGAAFSAISLFKLTAQWFPPKRFALVSGMCMTAAMLGAIFGQFPLSLFTKSFGWRDTLNLIGFAGVFLSLLYLFLVRDKTNDAKLSHQLNLAKKEKHFHFSKIFKNKQSWLLSLYSGLAFAPVSVFGGLWGVPFIVEAHGLATQDAAFATSFIFIGFAVGAPFLGWLSDKIKKRKPVMLWGPAIALLSLSIVIYCPLLSLFALCLLLFCFGFGASGFFTSFAMIREVFPLTLAATVLGFMNTFDSVCEAVTEPIVGIILDGTWNGKLNQHLHVFTTMGYQISLSVLIIYLLIALLILRFINETNCTPTTEN